MENKISFLSDTLNYLEERIRFIDTKASILLGLQAGIFVVFSLVVSRFFPSSPTQGIHPWSKGAIALYFIMLIVLGLLSVHIIRPAYHIWTSKVSIKQLPATNYIMWPQKEVLNDVDVFNKYVDEQNDYTIVQNYKRSIYVSLQLLDIKYRRYMKFIAIFKIRLVYCGTASLFFYVVLLLLN